MDFKLKFKNNNKETVEAKFHFEELDSQFKIIQIFSAVSKKYPDFLKTNHEKDEKSVDFSQMDAVLYCGELVMKNCKGYEIDGTFIKTEEFKTKEGVEKFFKYSIMEYMEMVAELMGFIGTALEQT